jgi:16S rRNA (uracil1498-N3)-methyltransferase
VRRFFLARTPAEGRPELTAADAEHALRVLRLSTGDRLIGLDGRGGAWPLSVRSAGKGMLELDPDGPVRLAPPPGSAGAALPWVEIALPWPKGNRLEEMLDRLTQLGAASIAELACERGGPRAALDGARRARAERVLREACKQCGRTWLPELRSAPSAAGGTRLLLDPSGESALAELVRPELRSAGRAWTVLVGPEGGFTDEERAAFVAEGAIPVSLGPHVLRLETAAEAAMAILGCALSRPRRT